MKIKNEYEAHIVECYSKNKIYMYLTEQLRNIHTIDEDKMWVLSQIDYDDQCIRTILVNDHRIIFYGGSLYALKGDKRQKDSDAFENHPATVCEYTHESFMYSPIKPYTSTNGKVRVGVPRAVELLTEKLKEFIATSHPEFEFGKTSSFNFSGQTYFAFEYKVPPLNWKSWF